MARKTWVQDPITHKLIPKEEYVPRGPERPLCYGRYQPLPVDDHWGNDSGDAGSTASICSNTGALRSETKIKPRKVIEPSRGTIAEAWRKS